jgi:hypothetical protein
MGAWATITPPTYEAAGQQRQTCSTCNHAETSIIHRLITAFSRGDVNGDALISIVDAVELLMFIAGMNTSVLMNSNNTPARDTPSWEAAFISAQSRAAFAANPDTAVPGITDAIEILMYLAKMPESAS